MAAQVEVELLMLREDLEDKGLEKAEVDAKIQQQREKLMASAEQANEAEVEKEQEAAEKPTTSSRCLPPFHDRPSMTIIAIPSMMHTHRRSTSHRQ